MFRMPTMAELEHILKKLEMGFELTDWELWICKEFL